MTTFEALVSVSQTLLRVNGRWCVTGIDETLRRDIRATVGDVARLITDAPQLEEMAIAELERRAQTEQFLERRAQCRAAPVWHDTDDNSRNDHLSD